MNFYNDNDPKAAAWLRELIKQGHLPPGHVDERSILDIKPTDLHGYTQVHLFAGIGGWPLALALADWPQDRPAFTFSCPCQPLSCAGQRKGHADERHLWPAVYGFVTKLGPATCFGEQVASPDGREWFAGVRADLEGAGYACGCANLPAASVGAPHRRERLFFVAHAKRDGGRPDEQGRGQEGRGAHGRLSRMADPHGRQSSHGGLQRGREHGQQSEDGGIGAGVALGDTEYPERRAKHQEHGDTHGRNGLGGNGDSGGLGNAEGRGCGERGNAAFPRDSRHAECAGGAGLAVGGLAHPTLPEGARFRSQREQLYRQAAWGTFDVIPCRDGKARRIESGTFPLAHGIPARLGRLRGYGNAICPQVAATFIRAYLETESLT